MTQHQRPVSTGLNEPARRAAVRHLLAHTPGPCNPAIKNA